MTSALELYSLRKMLTFDISKAVFCQRKGCGAVLSKYDAVSLTIGNGPASVVCGRCWQTVKAGVLAAIDDLPAGTRVELLDGSELWARRREC
jgi:hypothetical protein